MSNKCTTCNGTGMVKYEKKANAFGPAVSGKVKCKSCGGSGVKR